MDAPPLTNQLGRWPVRACHTFGAIALLLLVACDYRAEEQAKRRLDYANLEPYRNIPPGTVVMVRTRSHVEDRTRSGTSGQPAQYDVTNRAEEYVLEAFNAGSVRLRRSPGTPMSYAGRMIASIEPKAATEFRQGSVAGPEVAAFKIAGSRRPFLFNFRPPSWEAGSTGAAPRGVEGLQTVLAKGFKVTQPQGKVVVTLFDAVVCQAHRAQGEELGSSVMIFRDWGIYYPAGTSVLVPTGPMLLADLSEKTFAPPTTFSDVYEGEAAIKKLKEMGLEPPEDMDPNWKTRVK
jgi:hypothetical protein